jgi:hypothetical protein
MALRGLRASRSSCHLRRCGYITTQKDVDTILHQALGWKTQAQKRAENPKNNLPVAAGTIS